MWGYQRCQPGLDLQRVECFGPNPEKQLDVWHDWDPSHVLSCVCLSALLANGQAARHLAR